VVGVTVGAVGGAVGAGAAGAAAGAGVAVATANYQGCINQGGSIIVKLDAPLTLAIGAN